MNPALCPDLRNSSLLIELHESSHCKLEQIIQVFQERFTASHSMTFIPIGDRDLKHYQSLTRERLSEADLIKALDEVRGASRGWYILRPLNQ